MSRINASSFNLRAIARQVMLSRGFLVEFPSEVIREAAQASEPPFDTLGLKDLSAWLWSSIDNDDSRDLDQIEYAESEKEGVRLYLAVANVNAFVPLGSATDEAARHNTTSLYTGVQTFPMLPEKFSFDISSLVEGQKRLAVVVEILLDAEGGILQSAVYPAIVQNKAQLTYTAVATWLEEKTGGQRSGPATTSSPRTTQVLEKIRQNGDLQNQLVIQDRIAQTLRQRRHTAGALSLQTLEFRPAVSSEGDIDLSTHESNRATQLIEDLMIAANQAGVTFLDAKGFPSFRRVVRIPKRWDRIVELAVSHGGNLPSEPDAIRLEAFLKDQLRKDPEHFPDLSLAVIKLLGRGEYVVKAPGEEAPGHFSLAVENYAHSTAPNRRYPDVITQRLLLAACTGQRSPYAIPELVVLAQHCTEKEDDANKVERSVHKSIAAAALSTRIGEVFPGVITGVTDQGVWVRLLHPPVEGKVISLPRRVDVGDKVQVRLVETNPQRGYIDFSLIHG